MIKKLFLFLSFTIAALAVKAYDAKIKGIYYTLNYVKMSAIVTSSGSANSYSGNIVIPETVTYSGVTYTVTSIGGGAFYKCTGLTSVTIPNSVTTI